MPNKDTPTCQEQNVALLKAAEQSHRAFYQDILEITLGFSPEELKRIAEKRGYAYVPKGEQKLSK